jgi:hypothetical protein
MALLIWLFTRKEGKYGSWEDQIEGHSTSFAAWVVVGHDLCVNYVFKGGI